MWTLRVKETALLQAPVISYQTADDQECEFYLKHTDPSPSDPNEERTRDNVVTDVKCYPTSSRMEVSLTVAISASKTNPHPGS